MKRYLISSLVFLFTVFLVSCATSPRAPYIKNAYAEENWMNGVASSPNSWSKGADRWFLTGDPNVTEESNRTAPGAAAISTMMVRVPDFSQIRINGDFQVQLYGTYEHGNVYVFGPNQGVRDIAIDVRGNTLNLIQTKKSLATRKVIIRIGVNHLNSIMQLGGCGTIEGIRLHSNALSVVSARNASGNIYLAGNPNLHKVTNAGVGNINIFGATSNGLDVSTFGGGNVNISGKLNVRCVNHHGRNDINLIGVNSRMPTRIYADGMGKVSLNGQANIREIRASGQTCVYAFPVNSQYMYVYVSQNARVGLAGATTDLFVNTTDRASFLGKYLCAQNAYVRAARLSHINVTASNRIFASATQSSSVYFFGAPDNMSQFVSGSGVVIPIWSSGPRYCGINFVPTVQKRPMYKGEAPQYKWKKGKLVKAY